MDRRVALRPCDQSDERALDQRQVAQVVAHKLAVANRIDRENGKDKSDALRSKMARSEKLQATNPSRCTRPHPW
jgi:RNA processing factor Prp31